MDKQCEPEPETIEDVLECVEEAGDGEERVAVSDIVDRIGDGAFPPLMLVPALVMLSPATAIFGVATVCGTIIALIAFQMVIGRKKLWLPGFIRDRTISTQRMDKAIHFLSKPAHFIDKLTRARLSFLVERPFDRVLAGVCVILVLFVPVFELVPMSATIIGAAISLFGLAMLARDGLLAIMGLVVLGGAFWLVWSVAT